MHAEKIDPDDPRVLELKVRLSFTPAEKLTNLQQIVEHHPDRPEFAAQLEREKAKAEDPQKILWPPGQYPPNRSIRFE
jgi:hypothetical protein